VGSGNDPGVDDHVRDGRDKPVLAGGRLQLIRAMRGEREDKQREEEGREQHQERESVSVVGVCWSGKLRVAVLPPGAQIHTAQEGKGESRPGGESAGAQASAGELLRDERSSGVRPGEIVRVSELGWGGEPLWGVGFEPEGLIGSRLIQPTI